MMLLTSLVFLVVVVGIDGHGYIIDPPGRSSLWRLGYKTPPNYNDNQLFCGGFYVQQYTNRGKCGICGDPFNGPRDNEAGGKYAKGIISKTYQSGKEVTLRVIITANHLGWFEFKLCPNNNPKVAATQSCLDSHVLQLADGSGTKYHINSNTGPFDVKVRLPEGLTCTQCVLQWRWHTGNSWGVNPNGRGCIGCGAQEEFYGCADVAITGSGHPVITSHPQTELPESTPTSTSTSTHSPTHHVTTPRPSQPPVHLTCLALNNWSRVKMLDRWCTRVCNEGKCPSNVCKCSKSGATPKPPAKTTTTTATTTKSSKGCFAINNWAGVPSLDKWCSFNCAQGHCPKIYCKCA